MESISGSDCFNTPVSIVWAKVEYGLIRGEKTWRPPRFAQAQNESGKENEEKLELISEGKLEFAILILPQ